VVDDTAFCRVFDCFRALDFAALLRGFARRAGAALARGRLVPAAFRVRAFALRFAITNILSASRCP
jgi:hypothetical protein